VIAATNPYRTFAAEGLRWTSGTDGPITGDDYFGGMHLAVHRKDEQAITVEEAFRVAAGGCLAVGERFDAIALDCDPFSQPALLGSAKVIETWVGGKRLWRRPPVALPGRVE
jgi:predicted amidohydrolase YtcJ